MESVAGDHQVRVSQPETSPRLRVSDGPPSLGAKLSATAALSRIRILVAVQPPLLCQGLSALMRSQPDFRVVGEASTGVAAVRLAHELAPEVVLLGQSFPGCSVVDSVRELRRDGGASIFQIIVLTVAVEKTDVVGLLRAGARGIVLKEAPADLVFKCIRRVHAGEVWIGRAMLTDVVEALASCKEHEEPARPPNFGLTRREREILKLVLEAETNKGIAERLSVTEDTVKHHLTNIFDKTGASNRLELALFAMHHRLDLDPPSLADRRSGSRARSG